MTARTGHVLKIVLLGDDKVGKTSIINQYVAHEFRASAGSDFSSKQLNINDQRITVNIWGVSG